jgi:hypothetical protein
MTKISSAFMPFYKRLFPLFWSGFIAVFVAATVPSGNPRGDLVFLVVAPCVMAVVGFRVDEARRGRVN